MRNFSLNGRRGRKEKVWLVQMFPTTGERTLYRIATLGLWAWKVFDLQEMIIKLYSYHLHESTNISWISTHLIIWCWILSLISSRAFISIYFLVWFIVQTAVVEVPQHFIYLTTWGEVLLNLYFLCTLSICYQYYACRLKPEQIEKVFVIFCSFLTSF